MSRLRLRFGLLLGVSLFSFLSIHSATADTAPADKIYSKENYIVALARIEHSTRAQNQSLIDAIGELNGEGAKAIKASQKIAAFADQDLLIFVMYRLHQELMINSPEAVPNVEVIRSLIKCIGRTADQSFFTPLEELREILKDKSYKISRTDGHRGLFDEFDKAKKSVGDRLVIVPYVNPDLIAQNAVGNYTSFKDYLKKASEKPQKNRGRFINEKIPDSYEKFLLTVASTILTDDERLARQNNTQIPLQGREAESHTAIDVLVRPKAKMPVFVGAAGVGKSAMGRVLAQMILDGDYPQTPLYQNELANAEIIVTTPAQISQMALSNEDTAQAAAVELFFEAVRGVEANYLETFKERRPIIVMIDGIHTMDTPQFLALKKLLEDEDRPIRILATAPNQALEYKLKRSPEIKKLMEVVPLNEFTEQKATEIIKDTWVPNFKTRYNVNFDDDAIGAMMNSANYLRPGLARPEAQILSMQSMAIKFHREKLGAEYTITDIDVFNYVREITGVPANPYNAREFSDYLDQLKANINREVDNQERMVNVLVDQWAEVLSGDPRQVRAILFGGSTGVGKTLVAKLFAEYAFGNRGRIFKLDAPQLLDGKYAKGTVFGDPTGVNTKGQTAGTFMEWLDDPAGGKMGGVILIDEADKLPLDVWLRLMEFFSEGYIVGGDGIPRYANRHIVILTSNKGSSTVFPPGHQSWLLAEVTARVEKLTQDEIKNFFAKNDPADKNAVIIPPEILARITAAAYANPVTKERAPFVARIEINQYILEKARQLHVKLNVSDNVVNHLALTGLDYATGARPIKNQLRVYLTKLLTAARKEFDLPRNAEIFIDLQQVDEHSNPEFTASYGGKVVRSEAPVKPHENPLNDPRIRKIVEELEAIMVDHMVSQPEAAKLVAKSIRGKFADASRKRPLSIMLIGPTGGGKTEMARAIAKALHGDTNRIGLISLSENQGETVFGSSKQKGLLEIFVENNPDGGVLVIDEFSNVGGNDLAKKDAELKKWYTIKEEGVWPSPYSKTNHDMSKYTIVFTGNDLEKLMQGIMSDDERLAICKAYSNPAKIRTELKKGGVPEALLGREDVLAILCPPKREDKIRLTEHLIKQVQARFEKQHTNVKLTWQPEFIEQVADVFYSHDRGARSIRSFVENQITALAGEALISYGYDTKKFKNVNLELSLADNLPQKVFAEGPVVPRRVDLFVELFKDNVSQLKVEDDVTAAAAEFIVLNKSVAFARAYSLIGQALVNDETRSQQKLSFMTIRSYRYNDKIKPGYVRFEFLSEQADSMTLDRLKALLERYWAGRLAQERAGYQVDAAWAADLKEMRILATDYLKNFGQSLSMAAALVNDDGEAQFSSEQKKELETEMKNIFEETRMAAQAKLDGQWQTIEKLAMTLLDKAEMSGTEVEAFLKGNVPSNTAATCHQLMSQ